MPSPPSPSKESELSVSKAMTHPWLSGETVQNSFSSALSLPHGLRRIPSTDTLSCPDLTSRSKAQQKPLQAQELKCFLPATSPQFSAVIRGSCHCRQVRKISCFCMNNITDKQAKFHQGAGDFYKSTHPAQKRHLKFAWEGED